MDNSGSRFVWYELATTDTEAAKAFYARVVGWKAADVSMPGSIYTLFAAQGDPVAGMTRLMAGLAEAGVRPQWTGYVRVPDVDATAAAVRPLGGVIHFPPTDIPNVSRFSIIGDPEMATLALVTGREGGQEPAKESGPGRVVWHELLAADPEKTFTFYNKLFGWRKANAHTDAFGTYQEFFVDGAPVGGIYTRPPVLRSSVWIHYVHVPDVDAAAKSVVAGGGKVLYGPVTVPGKSQIAHCSDPQGAIFGLLERKLQVAIGCYAPSDPAQGRAK